MAQPKEYIYNAVDWAVYNTNATHDLDGDFGGPAREIDIITSGTFTFEKLDGTSVGPLALNAGVTIKAQCNGVTIASGGALIAYA